MVKTSLALLVVALSTTGCFGTTGETRAERLDIPRTRRRRYA